MISFLDSYHKAENVDPLHKWIGTYNLYRMHLMRFFKWLYYPDIEQNKREVYRALKDKVKDVVMLHSQFARRDRNDIENELLRSKLAKDNEIYKPLPKILVSTQVVEVSLDLDFPQGFTEPAAIDALVQRMGRINRYGAQRQPAKVRIFEDQLSNDNTVYSAELRDKSLEVLIGLSMPLSEEELNHAADLVYGNG